MIPSLSWRGSAGGRALPSSLRALLRWIVLTPERPDDSELQRKARLLAVCTSFMVPLFISVDAALAYQLEDYVPPYFGYPVLLASYFANRAGLYHLAARLVGGLVPFVVFGQIGLGVASDVALTLGYLPVGILLATMFLSVKGVAAVSTVTVFGIVVLHELAPQLRELPSMVLPLSSNAICGAAAVLYMIHRNELESDRREAQSSLEVQLRQSQKMEAVGQLAGGIAHDFNNALTVISGNATLLARRVDHRELQNIQKAVDSASQLTRQLLAFGRRAMIHPTAVDLHTEVSSCVRMLERIIGEDVRMEVRTEPNLWTVRVDAAQIQEIVFNLATNARDAMPEGGRMIFETANLPAYELTAHDGSRRRGDYVLLSVRDTGAGMQEGVRQRMFEPFFTTKDMGKGTGLGLAMVFGAVTQNGGHIEVESRPGEGTTIRVLFPRDAEAAASAVTEGDGDALLEGASGTILLVEDEPAVRALCEAILVEQGYCVHSAPDAAKARALFAEHRESIDLVVTDLVMPGEGGLDLARALRRDVPGLPVLFMSGYADTSEAVPSGAFLGKPFTAESLLRAVQAMRRRRTPTDPT